VLLGLAGVATMPAAIAVSKEWHRVALLDTAYAVPLAFLLGVLAAGMARRAKRNIRWLGLDNRGAGVARAGVILGMLAVSLALMAALSVGFYEAIQYYQAHH
jgi:hypothetical protein